MFFSPPRGSSHGELIDLQAVSVSIPTWTSNIGYGNKEPWVMDSLRAGYPRSLPHSPHPLLRSLALLCGRKRLPMGCCFVLQTDGEDEQILHTPNNRIAVRLSRSSLCGPQSRRSRHAFPVTPDCFTPARLPGPLRPKPVLRSNLPTLFAAVHQRFDHTFNLRRCLPQSQLCRGKSILAAHRRRNLFAPCSAIPQSLGVGRSCRKPSRPHQSRHETPIKVCDQPRGK
jgi:hypothetical protein